MRISDWSSDVCSSDLRCRGGGRGWWFHCPFFVFPFGCGHRPAQMPIASQRPCQFLQSPEFPGFFPFSPPSATILFVTRFPLNRKSHHLMADTLTDHEASSAYVE